MANSIHPSGISLCEKYVFLPFSSFSSALNLEKDLLFIAYQFKFSRAQSNLKNPRRLWQLTHLFIYRLVACLKEFQEAWCPFANSLFSMYLLILFSLQFLSRSWLRSQLSFYNSPKHPISNCSQTCSPLFLWRHDDKWQLKLHFGGVQQFHTCTPSNLKNSKSI